MNFAISSGIAAPKNAALTLPKMLVASAGYTPINPNGIDIQNDNGIDNIPKRNAFTNCPVGSGDFLSLWYIKYTRIAMGSSG